MMASLLQGVISEMNQIEGSISFGRVQDEIFMANGFAEGNNKVHRKHLEVSHFYGSVITWQDMTVIYGLALRILRGLVHS